MSINLVACGTRYTGTDGTELGGIELQRSSYFFQVRGPAVALWFTRSDVELFCNVCPVLKSFSF